MDYLMEMSKLELFTETLALASICDRRIAEWNNARTKEECERAEDLYYVAQEAWAMVMGEVERRGIKNEYENFCEIVMTMGWV